MNVGIYFNNTHESEPLIKALQSLNEGVSEGALEDASIFYDNCGPNSIPAKCGFFDSVDIWHFTGNLITTSIETTKKALNIVNKFDTIFYYGWYGEKDPIELIRIARDESVRVVCNNQSSKKEFIRLTGCEPHSVAPDFDLYKIIEV